MKVTINASPLIFLAKIGKVDLLTMILRDFRVTDIVWEEAVRRGLDHRYVEADLIRTTVNNRVVEAEKGKAKKVAKKFGIHIGEASTILLAKKLHFRHVIVDDKVAIKVAKIMGLKPLSTPFILLKALKEHHLSHDEFINCFEKLTTSGYYITPSLSREILERAEEMKTQR
ncbi:hypothetical protein IBX38_01230 [Candidatus Bathyarchaeota archaeon]|nr:hypothetical protein [Candidatus Bathyarchaeota archaeon]